MSILVCISKIFERVYSKQMTDFFDAILSISLSAFRKSYSCETVLVRLVEYWKALLDKHQVVGPCFLIWARHLIVCLSGYCSPSLVPTVLIMTLISLNHRQRVTIGDSGSEWLSLEKGVPQGSILGPLLFNIFLNDIFYNISGLYNYAADNTISRHGDSVAICKNV